MTSPGQGPPAQTSTYRSQPRRHSHFILLRQCQGNDVYKAQGLRRGLSSAGAPHLGPGRLRPGGPKGGSPRHQPWVAMGCGFPAPVGRQNPRLLEACLHPAPTPWLACFPIVQPSLPESCRPGALTRRGVQITYHTCIPRSGHRPGARTHRPRISPWPRSRRPTHPRSGSRR